MSKGQLVKYAVTIARPREEIYQIWHDWHRLPEFSPHLISVTPLDEKTTEWTVRGPNGNVTWKAETVNDTLNEKIGWRSVEGSEIDNHGVVQFFDAPGNRGTEVHVHLSYDAPWGALGKYIAKATGNEPEQEVGEMMRRMKALLECGEIPIVEGQPSWHMRGEDKGADASRAGLR